MGPPALGMWSFSLRTTREVPLSPFLPVFFHRSPSAILHKPVSLLQSSYLSSCSEQGSKLTSLIEIILLYKISQRHSVANFLTSSVLLLYTSPPPTHLSSRIQQPKSTPADSCAFLGVHHAVLSFHATLSSLSWLPCPNKPH